MSDERPVCAKCSKVDRRVMFPESRKGRHWSEWLCLDARNSTTNHITGESRSRLCYQLNSAGECQYFEAAEDE